MISHKYKCIFIHIPCTAGSSIEKCIFGKDWWGEDRKTKHIFANQAKKIYKDYWNDYFKFSFVRNPWDRFISMGKYPHWHKINVSHQVGKAKIIFDEYLDFFSGNEILEFNTKEYLDQDKFIKNSIYLNYINEEIDFIGKFENLKENFAFIKKKLDVKEDLPHIEKTNRNGIERLPYREYYNNETRDIVFSLQEKDIKSFGYSF
tara:strand:+ start:814 stop:1425 length:612 start_codon:yes stop_codon:yes gene_type:complete